MTALQLLVMYTACAHVRLQIDYMPAGLHLRCRHAGYELTQLVTREEFPEFYNNNIDAVAADIDWLIHVLVKIHGKTVD